LNADVMWYNVDSRIRLLDPHSSHECHRRDKP